MSIQAHYKFVFNIVRPVLALFMPQKTIGRENIPEGACVVCANHSNAIDPALVGIAMQKENYMHFMAKIEASKIPVINLVLKNIGGIYVRRGQRDIDSIKQTMKALKANEKVMVFPEGTRVRKGKNVEPKTGVIHVASKAGVPILPVYVPTNKKAFQKVTVVIGKPFTVEITEHDDYEEQAKELMKTIYGLKQ